MLTLTLFVVFVAIFSGRRALAASAFMIFLAQLGTNYAKLRQYTGPWLAGITDWWFAAIVLGNESQVQYQRLEEQYGDIVRVGPTHLLTSCPDLWIHVNQKKTGYPRSPWFFRAVRFTPGADTLFSQCNLQKHNERRRQMMAGYTGKENPTLESDVDKHVSEFLSLIRRKYTSTAKESRPMDFGMKVHYLAIDVISGIGLGKSFGDLQADDDLDAYIWSTVAGSQAMALKVGLGISHLFENKIFNHFLGPSEKDATGFGHMKATARLYIQERLTRETETESDMIASFVRHGVPKEDLFNECVMQILAGTDTTSTAIRAVVLRLLTDERVFVKLRAEIDATVPTDEGSIVSDAMVKDMTYLQAVFRESLRMHPPVAALFTRCVPAPGDTFQHPTSGERWHFPSGTCISISVGMHTSKAKYGDDADVFRPERWLPENTSSDKLARMTQINDLVFGHGMSHCLGRPIAMMEMGKVVVELLKAFEVGLVRPEKPWRSRNHIGLYAQDEMWVRLEERVR